MFSIMKSEIKNLLFDNEQSYFKSGIHCKELNTNAFCFWAPVLLPNLYWR